MINFLTERHSDSHVQMRTEGLISLGNPEILVEFDDSGLVSDGEAFLSHIVAYIAETKRTLSPGETMAYGYWITKFQVAGPDILEVWEYDASATEFVKGASLALSYWKEQHSICQKYGADFQPPRPDKLTVISEGVLEGLPVQGVRYPSAEHMSGWWITTDLYDGNVDSLKHEHTYHVTAACPKLAKYLALPPGFRFDLASFEDVWFDEKVAFAE